MPSQEKLSQSKRSKRQRKRRRTDPDDISSPSSSSASSNDDDGKSILIKKSKLATEVPSTSVRESDTPTTLGKNETSTNLGKSDASTISKKKHSTKREKRAHKLKRDSTSRREPEPESTPTALEAKLSIPPPDSSPPSTPINAMDEPNGKSTTNIPTSPSSSSSSSPQPSPPPTKATQHPPKPDINTTFETWYLRAVATQFGNDLDKLRTEAADFKARPREAMAVLTKALRQGAGAFGEEDRRLVLGVDADRSEGGNG